MDSTASPKKPTLRTIAGYLLRWLLPLALTVILVVYMFRKVNFHDMWEIMIHGVDYWWILLAMAISVVSHIARAARWRIQLRALGINPPFMALCCSIFGTYALNLIFPRLGEVWRCSYIAGIEHKPFTTVTGSMVADRISDLFSVAILTLFAFIVATPQIQAFLTKYPMGQGLISAATNPVTWILIVGIIAAIYSIFHFGGRYRPIAKTRQWIAEAWKGFAMIAKMEGRGRFCLLTLAIWGCYFIQLYVAFFAFPFTRNLCTDPALAWGLAPCLVTFVLSSIGMAVPSNGGLGPWNIAVMFGLSLYGVSDPQGTAFSMLQWSGQTVMLIILGIFTMVYIALNPSKKHPSNSQKS